MSGMERKLWAVVKRGLSPHLNLRRFENSVDAGDPDVYFHDTRGRHGWIELKAKAKPARDDTRVFGSRGLRDAQVSRILELSRCKVPVFILAQVSDHLFLLRGGHCAPFNDCHIGQLGGLSDWQHQGAMRKEHWAELANKLVGGD